MCDLQIQIEKLYIEDGNTLVITSPFPLTNKQISSITEQLKEYLYERLGHTKIGVLFLFNGMKIQRKHKSLFCKKI